MNIHEHQAKQILKKYGAIVPEGVFSHSVEELIQKARSLKTEKFVLKAQIHAGGRGKAGGVKLFSDSKEIESFSANLLGSNLITAQTGKSGVPVNKLLVEKIYDIHREIYLAIIIDAVTKSIICVASEFGGVNIEEVAETNPDAIVTEAIDIKAGVQPEQTERIAKALGFAPENMKDAQEQMSNLYDLMIGTDAVQVEINPFAEANYVGADSQVFCVDAKLGFDDNASYRQKEIYAMRDTSMEDERDVRADEVGVEYIGLDGNIGCMVNGAGLAMATMDIVKQFGKEPANFLDLGGTANKERTTKGFKIIQSDPNVKSVLINIFGGIIHCDMIANGIIDAIKELNYKLPVVVRFQGTNAAEGKNIINKSSLGLVSIDDLTEAAKKVVDLASK